MKNQKLKNLSHFKGEKGLLVEDIAEVPKNKIEEKFEELERYPLRNFIKTPKEPTEKDKEKRKKQKENAERRKKLRAFFLNYEIVLENEKIKLEKIKETDDKITEICLTDIKGALEEADKQSILDTLQKILNGNENINLSSFKNNLNLNLKRLKKIKSSLIENRSEFIKEKNNFKVRRKRSYVYEYYHNLKEIEEYSNNIEKSFGILYNEEDINVLKSSFMEKKLVKNSVYETYHKILEKNLTKISGKEEIKQSIKNKTLTFVQLENLNPLTKSQLIYKYLLENNSNKKEFIENSFLHLVEMEMKYILKNLLSLKKNIMEDKVKNLFEFEKLKKRIKYRLENKLRDYIGRRGKFEEYKVKESTTFELNKIRKSESELRGFSSVVTSASFSCRNIIDKDCTKDILSLKNIDKNKLDIDIFKLFFPTLKKLDNNDVEIFMKELKEYIFELRNNTLHFNSNGDLTKLLKESTSKIPSLGNIKLKEFEKDYVKIFILEKYNSAGVFDWLSSENIKEFFKKVKTKLFVEIPKLSPSFDKLYSKFEDFNNLLKLNFKKLDEEKGVAYKFLLSEIYYNRFLTYFFNEENESFKEAVKQVIKLNKEAYLSKKTGHSKLDKFEKTIKLKTPIQYITQLQSYYSKSKEESTNENGENEILIFIRKIFIKGFFNFLNRENYNNILKLNDNSEEKKQIISKELLELKEEELNSSKTTKEWLDLIEIEDWEELNNDEKAFYCFLRLIDTKERANLKGFLEKTDVLSDSDDIKRFSKVLTLVSLINIKDTNLNNDISIFKKLTEFKGDTIKELFEFGRNDKEENESLYCDEKNIKNFKATHNLKKYATLKVIAELVEKTKYKVTKEEIEKHYEQKEKIKEYMKTQEKLHNCYVNPKKYGSFDRKKYEEAVVEISKYINLKNKIEFNDLNLLQSLLLRILYRTAGYVAMWERDLKFKLLTIREKNDPIEEIFDYKKWYKIQKRHEGDKRIPQICKKYSKFLEENKDKENQLPKNIKFENSYMYLRNYIAHFNYIPTPEFSLLDVFIKMRELLDYDRKLKNAYLKSIKDIFIEYGFEVEFELSHTSEKKNLIIKKVTSLKTIHLKKDKNPIEIDKHSEELCGVIKKMLEYKKEVQK